MRTLVDSAVAVLVLGCGFVVHSYLTRMLWRMTRLNGRSSCLESLDVGVGCSKTGKIVVLPSCSVVPP